MIDRREQERARESKREVERQTDESENREMRGDIT